MPCQIKRRTTKKSNANANLEFFNKLDGEPEKTCNVTLLFNMKTMLICDCVSRPGLCKASLSSAEVWVPVLEQQRKCLHTQTSFMHLPKCICSLILLTLIVKSQSQLISFFCLTSCCCGSPQSFSFRVQIDYTILLLVIKGLVFYALECSR